MTSISIDIMNPKANKAIKELEALGLIRINKKPIVDAGIFELSDEFKIELDKEYSDYKNKIGENYTFLEVFGKYIK